MTAWHSRTQMTETGVVANREELSLCYGMLDEMLPSDVHFTMFMPTLETQVSNTCRFSTNNKVNIQILDLFCVRV